MGWNNMKSFSIPGSEACQNDRVWHDQYRTDVHGNGAHSVLLCTRTKLLLQTPLYRNSKYNSLYSFTLLLSVELHNIKVIPSSHKHNYTGLFISPSVISELDCATTTTDTAERSISIGRESLHVFFCTRGLGVLPGSTARG